LISISEFVFIQIQFKGANQSIPVDVLSYPKPPKIQRYPSKSIHETEEYLPPGTVDDVPLP
jgi:hypothetical protein